MLSRWLGGAALPRCTSAGGQGVGAPTRRRRRAHNASPLPAETRWRHSSGDIRRRRCRRCAKPGARAEPVDRPRRPEHPGRTDPGPVDRPRPENNPLHILHSSCCWDCGRRAQKRIHRSPHHRTQPTHRPSPSTSLTPATSIASPITAVMFHINAGMAVVCRHKSLHVSIRHGSLHVSIHHWCLHASLAPS